MRIRILDLDGALTSQTDLLRHYKPEFVSLPGWGPALRMACRFGRFRRFAKQLAVWTSDDPVCTLYGSGDFHHVSLALVQRLRGPFNLLVVDNHPDWMRGIPFLHCGTWLYHAARLPQVRHVFHVGGDVDFDNAYTWLAPWDLIRSGKITACPARRVFQGRRWRTVPNEPLRPSPSEPLTTERMRQLLAPHRARLAECPLYISVDKDVLVADEATVNWDSGHLRLPDVLAILEAFQEAAGGRLAGMDTVGDWSPVRVGGILGRTFHLTMHTHMTIDPAVAARRNERVNLALLRMLNHEGHASRVA